MGSKGESVQYGGGITSELLCNKSWSINTGYLEDSATQEKHKLTHSCIHALNHTTDLM